MIKAVIFDVGGVIVSNEMESVYEDIKGTFGIDTPTFEKAWTELMPLLGTGKITEDIFWKEFLEITHSSKSLPEQSLLSRKYLELTKLNTQTIEIAKKLVDDGYQIALLSNTIKAHVDINSSLGFFEIFDTKIFSNEVGMRKPDPQIFQLALKRLGRLPHEAIFIDDDETYVSAACKLGIIGIIYKNIPQLKSDLTQALNK
ncbi:MAG: HAD family phosphatase [Candidatus Levybacteria bacterium]|nr:HAD family phosphatase [Candidatus Levybacteria bacterium]